MAGSAAMPVGDEVHHFSRLRLGSGEPVAVETTWLPAAVAPGLRESDLHGSLYELPARRYALVIGEAKVTIDPVMPDARTRTLLRIGEEQACLRIRMVDLDERGHVVMVAHCIYRGDQYQLTADVTGAAFGGDRTCLPGAPTRTAGTDDPPPAELVLTVDSGGSGTRIRHGAADRVLELPVVAWTSPDVPAALAAAVIDGWERLGRPDTALVALGIAATPSSEEEIERLARPVMGRSVPARCWSPTTPSPATSVPWPAGGESP